MGMFETKGSAAGGGRKETTLKKLERMDKALHHREPDRVPISDFFWGSFVQRWRNDLNLPADANPYYYYDLYFKPWVKAMAAEAHQHGLPVIYHGCGRVHKLLEDYIEVGIDAYNPLEVKAGMDVNELRGTYGHRIGFCGGNDIQVWETGDKEKIRHEVLRALKEAKGGGYIFQSDHSVSGDVSGHTYDYIVKLVREHGTYPITLG